MIQQFLHLSTESFLIFSTMGTGTQGRFFLAFQTYDLSLWSQHCCRYFPRGLKHHVGINSVLLCSKQKLSVGITQESRLNDIVAKLIAFES